MPRQLVIVTVRIVATQQQTHRSSLELNGNFCAIVQQGGGVGPPERVERCGAGSNGRKAPQSDLGLSGPYDIGPGDRSIILLV